MYPTTGSAGSPYNSQQSYSYGSTYSTGNKLYPSVDQNLNQDDASNKKRKTWIIVGVIVGIILLAGIVFLIIFLTHKSPEDKMKAHAKSLEQQANSLEETIKRIEKKHPSAKNYIPPKDGTIPDWMYLAASGDDD